MGIEFEREQRFRTLPEKQMMQPSSFTLNVFKEICLDIKNPNQPTEEEALAFDEAGQMLRQEGWALSQMIGLYWELRPDYQRPEINGEPITPEAFADTVILNYEQEKEEKDRAWREAIWAKDNPDEARSRFEVRNNPLKASNMELRAFHRAMIQHAAETGEQIVYRALTESIAQDLEEFGLPPHILPASRTRPGYPER